MRTTCALLFLAVLLTACGGSTPRGYRYDQRNDLLCPSDQMFSHVANAAGGDSSDEDAWRLHLEGTYGYETVDTLYGFAVPYPEFPGFYKLTFHVDGTDSYVAACGDVSLW